MLRSQGKNANNMKAQTGIFFPKLSSSVEMLVKKNYLDAAQEIKFKRIIICWIEEVNELKEDTDSSMKLRKINIWPIPRTHKCKVDENDEDNPGL